MTCTDLVTAQEERRASVVDRADSTGSGDGGVTAPVELRFLRVHIDRYTAVVQKKHMPLREALQQKLKNQNMDIEKCVAFFNESK